MDLIRYRSTQIPSYLDAQISRFLGGRIALYTTKRLRRPAGLTDPEARLRDGYRGPRDLKVDGAALTGEFEIVTEQAVVIRQIFEQYGGGCLDPLMR